MKRFALLAVAIVATCAALADAQVIDTYRPSQVTYYSSNTSVTPVAYYSTVPAASQYAANQYPLRSYPVTTAGATQVVGNPPVVPISYTNTATYANNVPYVGSSAQLSNVSYAGTSPYVAASPLGCGCGGAPLQSIAATSYYPTNNCATAVQPISYVQPVSYQQPVVAPLQPIAAPAGMINGKYYVGKGLLGRPKVYAQGQPIRNTLRRILP